MGVANLMHHLKNHNIFVRKPKILNKVDKLVKFTKDTRWIDWETIFINFIHAIPGRYGVPNIY